MFAFKNNKLHELWLQVVKYKFLHYVSKAEVHLKGSLPFQYKCFQKALSAACLRTLERGQVASNTKLGHICTSLKPDLSVIYSESLAEMLPPPSLYQHSQGPQQTGSLVQITTKLPEAMALA